MTLLEAVNEVLRHLNETPVTGLSVANPTVGLILPALESAKLELLSNEWYFNTFEWRDMLPDSNGVISTSADIIALYPHNTRYVWNGTQLLDSLTGIPTSETVSARVVFNRSFEQLPAVAQQYIVAEAAHRVYVADFGVDGASQNLQEIAATAFMTLTAQHVRTRKHTAKQRRSWVQYKRRLSN